MRWRTYDYCTRYPPKGLFIYSIVIRMGIYIHSTQALSYSCLNLGEIDIPTSTTDINLDEY